MENARSQNSPTGRRYVLAALDRALDQSAFALRDHPAECFPQLHARLHAEAENHPQLAAILDARPRDLSRVWLRVLNWRPRPLVRTFAGHTKSIDSLQFCAGGERIVSSSMDGAVRLWETATGRELAAFGGFSWSRVVYISPDDERFAFPNESRGLVLASAVDGQQLSALTFHSSSVAGCQFSPDGRWLASWGWDYKVAIWEVATATLHQSFHVDSEYPGIKFLATGIRLAFRAEDAVGLWDVEANQRRRFASAGQGRYGGIQLSADGALLATTVDKRMVVVWDVATGEVIARQTGHPGDIMDFRFLSDSRRMISAAAEGPVLVWDAHTGVTLARIEANGVDWMLVDPLERVLLLERQKGLSLWDLESSAQRAELSGQSSAGSGHQRLFSHDGRRLFTTGDSTVRAWDTETGARLDIFGGHTGDVSRCAIDRTGRLLLSAGSDHNLKLWNVAGAENWLPAAHTAGVSCCAVGPGGLAVASSLDGTVSWWDTSSGAMTRRDTEEGGKAVGACAISADGEMGAAGGAHDEMRISSARTGELVRSIPELSAPIVACAFSPDGAHVAWRSMGHGKFVARTVGEAPLKIIPGRGVRAIRFVPPGDRVVTITNHPYPYNGPDRSAVRLFDVHTGDRLVDWNSPDLELRDAACSPDGRLIATAGRIIVRVWSVAKGATVAELSHPEGGALDCVFSPDGRWLMASGDGAVRLWRSTTWREHGVLKISVACSPMFHPDGRHLLIAEPASLVVWDVKTLRPVTTLTGLTGGISAAAIAPDGRRLILGTSQGEVLVAAIDGLKSVPVVTATAGAASLQIRCPACGRPNEIPDSKLNHAWRCLLCAARLRVNAFIAQSPEADAPKAKRTLKGESATATESSAQPRKTSRLGSTRKHTDATSDALRVRQREDSLSRVQLELIAKGKHRSVIELIQTTSHVPTPHPAADADRAVELNIRYQKELAAWKALPVWKRFRTRKPEPPRGI